MRRHGRGTSMPGIWRCSSQRAPSSNKRRRGDTLARRVATRSRSRKRSSTSLERSPRMANLNDICLDLAWSHWTALGVRGVLHGLQDGVDIEALLLFTATLRDADPRLYDEVIDWCVLYGRDCVSISRLRRLYSALPEDQ